MVLAIAAAVVEFLTALVAGCKLKSGAAVCAAAVVVAAVEKQCGGGGGPDREVDGLRRRQDYLRRLGIHGGHGQVAGQRPPALRLAEQGRVSDVSEAAGQASCCDAGQARCASKSFDDDGLPVDKLQEESYAGQARDDSSFGSVAIGQQPAGDFRVDFLRKLSYAKVWVPQAMRPPKHQTVIIFDWDDTLLCTSYLLSSAARGSPAGGPVAQCLAMIERLSGQLLEASRRLGHTFIITNSLTGWVEYSAASWAPGLLPTLRSIPIVSARAKYEPQYPGDINMWKTQAFLEIQRQLDVEVIANLISLGDSTFEMDALVSMGKQFSEAMTKTIKFAQNPSPEELVKQLTLVNHKFDKIVTKASSLQVSLERRPCTGTD